MIELQPFYDQCVKALFGGTPFPAAKTANQREMLNDFRNTMKLFHRTKWVEEARDIGLSHDLATTLVESI